MLSWLLRVWHGMKHIIWCRFGSPTCIKLHRSESNKHKIRVPQKIKMGRGNQNRLKDRSCCSFLLEGKAHVVLCLKSKSNHQFVFSCWNLTINLLLFVWNRVFLQILFQRVFFILHFLISTVFVWVIMDYSLIWMIQFCLQWNSNCCCTWKPLVWEIQALYE